jgi:hypothetical protein
MATGKPGLGGVKGLTHPSFIHSDFVYLDIVLVG